MGMGEDDGVDAARLNRKRRPILQAQRLEALKQAAVDEQPMIALLDKVLRSRDRAGTAEEGEIQTHGGTFRNSGGRQNLAA